MSDLFNTKQVAQYLGINEKKVYYLAKAGKIPCTRVTGKWTFPKNLIDDWVEGSAAKSEARDRDKTGSILLVAGSDDPGLGILRDLYARRTTPASVFWATIGSSAGLAAIRDGIADVALAHLLDPLTGEYNLPYLRNTMPSGAAVVRLFSREIGLVTKPGNPLGIRSLADLARKKTRMINRQEGSGIRLFTDYHLRKLGIDGKKMTGYPTVVRTHVEVGVKILAGEADVGVATRAIARPMGLNFVDLAEEHFDMLIPKAQFASPGIQLLLEIIGEKAFRAHLQSMDGYDLAESGRILTLSS